MRRLSYGLILTFIAVGTGSASHLSAQGVVSGSVFEKKADGFVPVPHAWIEAKSPDDHAVAEVKADAYGHYVLSGLPKGVSVLRVRHPRYYPVRESEAAQTVNCPAVGVCGKVDFELTPNGRLDIVVTDPEGKAMGDVRVTVRALDQADTGSSWLARQRGSLFRTSDMRPGRFRVRAEPTKPRRDGTYQPAETEMVFAYGQQQAQVWLAMPFTPAYRVSGSVEGLLNWSALHLLVVLQPQDRPEQGSETRRLGAPLDKQGRFVLNGVERGDYHVNLVPLNQDGLAARSPEVLLGSVRVDEDVSGLAFELPRSLDPN